MGKITGRIWKRLVNFERLPQGGQLIIMSKKIRLRLHVEVDLLGTRVTPSPRLKDPYRAGNPKAHVLSRAQQTLWECLFPGRQAKSQLLERLKIGDLVSTLRGLAPADTKFKVVDNNQGYMIEVLQAIKLKVNQ